MLLAWLYVTEYVITLPFFLTAAVVAVIVVLGGVVTSRRTVRAFTVLAEVCRLERNRNIIEFQRVISMMPPLYEVFRVLHPQLANTSYGLCHFATWLNAALRNPEANIIEWAMSYGERAGRERPALRGLDRHIPEDRREGMATRILYAVLTGHANVVFLREEKAGGSQATSESGFVKTAA